jgi:hypothetical protein
MSARSGRGSITAIAVIALALAGCAGNGPEANTSTDLFSQLQREIFDVNCLSAGCHNPQSQAGGLVLTEGFSYQNLVIDSEPNNAAARAAGLQRVVPFDTAGSFLVIKLTNPGPGEGDRMPMGAPPLSADDLLVVNQWILAGAPPAMTQTVSVDTTATTTATPTATPPLPTVTSTSTETVSAPTVPPPTAPPNATPTTVPPSPSPTATQVVTLGEVQTQVFTSHCATEFCHSSTARAGNMVLEDGASFASLVNVMSDNFAAKNAGILRVNPGTPDESFLLIKLTGPTLEQGSRMPMGLPPLSDELISLVRNWIAQGANP